MSEPTKVEMYVDLATRDPHAAFYIDGVLTEIERCRVPDLTPLVPRSIRREIRRYEKWKADKERYK